MSGDAVKAYIYLLAESWLQEPRASLPTDDKELASMARVDYGVWMRVKEEVLQHYSNGKCKEHKGRYYQDTLLEISRKSESKQRFNNKNAKRTQTKRKVNADAEYENENEIEIKHSLRKGDSKGETWKTSFEIYQQEALAALDLLINDTDWMDTRREFHPNLDIEKSLTKAWQDFWATKAGWQNKRKKRSVDIDWKRTAVNALTQRMNQVWLPKEERNTPTVIERTLTEEEARKEGII